jgi:hypothetical protein
MRDTAQDTRGLLLEGSRGASARGPAIRIEQFWKLHDGGLKGEARHPLAEVSRKGKNARHDGARMD